MRDKRPKPKTDQAKNKPEFNPVDSLANYKAKQKAREPKPKPKPKPKPRKRFLRKRTVKK